MTTIGEQELRDSLASVLRRAEAGESFTITVDGRPVARLCPLPDSPERPTLAQALAQTPVDSSWAAELRRMRDEDVRPGQAAGSPD